MAAPRSKRVRLAVTLDEREAAAIARAAGTMKPSTWARLRLLEAAERSEAAVSARAERLLRELEAGLPGGAAHAGAVAAARRDGWRRGRR